MNILSSSALTTGDGVHTVLDHHFIEQVAYGSHGDLESTIGGYGREDLIVQIVPVAVQFEVDRGGGYGRRGRRRFVVRRAHDSPRIKVAFHVAKCGPSVGRGRTPSLVTLR
jgi:hypothetical protein